jgi:hypothetical protein
LNSILVNHSYDIHLMTDAYDGKAMRTDAYKYQVKVMPFYSGFCFYL